MTQRDAGATGNTQQVLIIPIGIAGEAGIGHHLKIQTRHDRHRGVAVRPLWSQWKGFSAPDRPVQPQSGVGRTSELLCEIRGLESIALIVAGLHTPEVDRLQSSQLRETTGFLNRSTKSGIDVLQPKRTIPDPVAIGAEGTPLNIAEQWQLKGLGIDP